MYLKMIPSSLRSRNTIRKLVTRPFLVGFCTSFNIIVELSNGDIIYLRSLPSNKIGEFVTQAKQLNLIDASLERVHATGGGAYKYSKLFESEFKPMGI